MKQTALGGLSSQAKARWPLGWNVTLGISGRNPFQLRSALQEVGMLKRIVLILPL